MNKVYLLRLNERALGVLNNAVLNVDDLLEDSDVSTLLGCSRKELFELLKYLKTVRESKSLSNRVFEISE